MSKDDESFTEEVEELATGESEVLHDLRIGVIAGLLATIAVALIILLQGAAGFVPELDILGTLASRTGLEFAGAGWILLFVGGGILGVVFALLDSHVGHVTGAGEIVHGVLFAFLLWAALLMILIPVYGGTENATTIYVVVLVANLIFGVAMGAIYGRMNPEEAPT
jgi:Na+-translocating ferredoxin:NAD+ oxidoreductase RnfD subunit